MHNNFYFLRQLSRELGDKLRGFTLVSVFTQNKEELILEFNNARESFFLRATLSPTFCCLSFPQDFHRARKNSVDLFEKVILKEVVSVHQYSNERSFSIDLADDLHLVFSMHGSRANVLLFEGDRVVEIFRNQFTADLAVRRTDLDRFIDWSHECFASHQDRLQEIYFTFGKIVWEWLEANGFEQANQAKRWALLQDLLKRLEKPEYLICRAPEKVFLSLVPSGQVIGSFDDPILAINELYYIHTVAGTLLKEKAMALRNLHVRLDRGKEYIAKNRRHLKELENDSHYQNWADLLMANMHRVKTGMEKITVDGFYDGMPVEIKLKKNLSPQKNAEVYYRKAKNQQIEIHKLKESIAKKEEEIAKLSSEVTYVETEKDDKALRKHLQQLAASQQPRQTAVSLPYREYIFKGFTIWVGKNAETNDALTQKHSFKDDLWLHAKDVSGSHVLIKYQAGKNFPQDVIEYAASLAAYFSKRKNESLCPVAYTPRKYVRKRKGDPAGMVVVEKEVVILVKPRD